MSPFASVWRPNKNNDHAGGASTTHILSQEDMQLRVHISRESETSTSSASSSSFPSSSSPRSPPLPSPLPAAYHHSARRQQQQQQEQLQFRDDALTDFFGGHGQRVRAQRAAAPTRGSSAGAEPASGSGARAHRSRSRTRAPPPYSPDWDGEKLPQYALGCGGDSSSSVHAEEEPETVARHMFKYGFFFPLFWVVGVYFLYAPLRVSPEWEADKTEEEREKILAHMRATERVWAKRCLWALLAFLAGLGIVIVAVVVVSRRG